MAVFWFMFLIPLAALFSLGRLRPIQAWLPWLLVGVTFSILMGFRHEVGGDWGTYQRHFDDISMLSARDVLSYGDPGYYLLNWIVGRFVGTVHWVNFICAAVLTIGTVVFCRRQPRPWLALAVAVPYMLVVVGMGYTRQSVALGFGLIGLAALGEARLRAFIFWVAVGVLFHKSAVLLLPIAALAASRNRWLSAAIVAFASALLYFLLVADSTEALWETYVVAEYQSEGGAIRVAMNALPAIIFLVWGRRLCLERPEYRLWFWMSVLALACVPLVFISSTAVDRVALYLIPVQLYVFARLPSLTAIRQVRSALHVGILAFYSLVLFVWLNYATHAEYWIPYQFMPFD